jgi:hypothetical protein
MDEFIFKQHLEACDIIQESTTSFEVFLDSVGLLSRDAVPGSVLIEFQGSQKYSGDKRVPHQGT